MQLQPNPAKEISTLSFSQPLESEQRLELISLDGRLLNSWQLAIGQSRLEIDLEQLVPAFYIL